MVTDTSRIAIEPPPARGRLHRPDPALLWALWKGVWSTVFTVVTLGAVIFVCANVEPKARHGHTTGSDHRG